MEQRMAALGFGWADVTATQVYTIFDIHPLLADEIVRRGASRGGLTWHFARPPVQELAGNFGCRDEFAPSSGGSSTNCFRRWALMSRAGRRTAPRLAA
jgi:hypothetical protein